MFRKTYGLYFAWFLACIGTLISLYYSEILKFEPCHMCWYQRIALYPLAIILGIATYCGERRLALYTLPLVAIGFLLALYQVGIQEIPGWNPIDMCGGGPSCAEKYEIGLGPITLPMLSAGNFFVMGLFLILAWPPRGETSTSR